MTQRFKYKFQLQDRPMGGVMAGPSITGSGGKVLVTQDGSPLKAALTDKDGVALTNPRALTRGSCEFYTVEDMVDLFIMCPDGQFVALWSVKPDALYDVPVDRSQPHQMAIIPVHITDYPAAVETDTGFDVPSQAMMLPTPFIEVTTLDATEDLEVGTATAETGDPDGFLDNISVNAAGLVKGTIANGTPTLGALLWVQDSANAGDEAPEGSVAHAGKSIVVMTSAGSDTVQAYVYLPYLLSTRAQPTL